MVFGKKILLVSDTNIYSPESQVLNYLKDYLSKNGYYVNRITPENQHSGLFSNDILHFSPYSIKEAVKFYDAIYIDTVGILGFKTRNACVKSGVKFSTGFSSLYTKHLTDDLGFADKIAFSYHKWFHKHSSSILVPNSSLKELLKEKGFKNIKLWPRSVDGEIFKARTKEKISEKFHLPDEWRKPFWITNSKLERKSLEEFCKLDLPGTKIIIGEDGKDKRYIERKYPEIKIFGPKRHYELAYLYNQSDVFVKTDKSYHFSIRCMEAISCGIPVASVPVETIDGIVNNGFNGVINPNLQFACEEALFLPRGTVRLDHSWKRSVEKFISNIMDN